MRKWILTLAAGLIASSTFAADAPAPLPREGSTSGITGLSGTVKVMPLGKDRLQFIYDVMGPHISDNGQGPFHNTSERCVGGMHIANGAFDDETGSCVFTRLDGDQIFTTHKLTGKLGQEAKGSYTIVGGTGKMAGITGSGEIVRVAVRPAVEGTSQTYARLKGTYKLP